VQYGCELHIGGQLPIIGKINKFWHVYFKYTPSLKYILVILHKSVITT